MSTGITIELEDLENYIRRVDRNSLALKNYTEQLELRIQQLEEQLNILNARIASLTTDKKTLRQR